MRPRLVCLVVLAASAALALYYGGAGESGPPPESQAVSSTVAGAQRVPSRVGEPPRYFVPNPEGSPNVIIGRARLLVSDQPAEFSAGAERVPTIGDAICVNPAYRGRGQMGIYIPTVCRSTPLPKFKALRVDIPDQAVKGYELVIWGVMRRDNDVTTRFNRARVEAAEFEVAGELAEKVGADERFSVFVVELPARAACEEIVLATAHGFEDRVAAKPRLCPRP